MSYVIPLFYGFLSLSRQKAVPIEFRCKNCKHSYKDHQKSSNPTTQCYGGFFGGCFCKKFTINERELEQANKELQEIREILFKYYDEAIKTENSFINNSSPSPSSVTDNNHSKES